MKHVLILLVALTAGAGWSKDVKDFNSELIKNVQKDIRTDNDDQFKVKRGRGPASASPVEVEPEQPVDTKLDRLKQIGPNKW